MGLLEYLDLPTVLVFLVAFVIIYNVLTRAENPPPSPRGLPVVGNMLQLSANRGRLPEAFMKQAVELGDVFSLTFGRLHIVVVSGYARIQEVLMKRADVFSDRPDFLLLTQKIGTGVILSNGQQWKDLRRMSLHAMRDFGMGKSTTEEKVQDEVEVIMGILSDNENKPIQVHKYLALATSNIICNIIFGSRFEYEDAQFQKMVRLLNDVFQRPGLFQICNAFPILRFVPHFKKGLVDNIEAFDRLAQFVSDIVTDHESTYDRDNIRDFIDMFIEFRDEDNDASYTLRNFLRVIVDLFMAGTETSSTTLNWALLYMVAYPDIQARCQQEMEEVIGTGRMVQFSDRLKLPYVESTLCEIQRISTIAPLSVPHATLQATTLGGFTIPRESIVLVNLLSVHMDPALWPDPGTFNPDRFLKDGKVHRGEYFMPFSAGPRVCAGETLAKMELFLYFANLLQWFTFKKVDGATLNLEGVTGLTRSPRPFEVVVTKR
ncbi:cytochrome P450 2J4-like [Haliotis cracherodii]|uniref:cytochrome P450 2J4-like n=1 Tax=Haliotis cracherodii TaxID=6455 RepID=UPI0039EA4382